MGETWGRTDDEVINFINEEIIPIIKNAEIAGMMLKEDVLQLPVAPRQEDGKIINLS